MLNIEVLKSKLNSLPINVKVLSFDVFDTLLIRMIRHEHVVQLAAEDLSRRLYAETSSALAVSDILNSRYEFKLKMDKAYFSGEAEWTLSEWLNEFAKKRSIDPTLLCRLGCQSELSAESLCLRMAPDAVNAILIARNLGLSTIAISDMWLDQDWLKKLLEKFGLFFDAVFSSGSMRVSKRRGTIFKKIEATLSLNADAFVHIGDNLKADFFRPRLSGWKSIWMPHPGNSFKIRALPVTVKHRSIRKTWKDIVHLLQFPSVKNESDPYFKLAYNHLAPLLIIFSILQWRRFRNQGVDVVFYIARDAKVMFDVYNILAHLLPDSCSRRYIRLSRRVVAIVHPDDLFQNVMHLPGKVGKRKVSEWLSNFTISSELRNEILSHAGVHEKDDFTEHAKESFRSACRKFLPAIIEEQNAHKQIIKDYLIQQAGKFSFKRIGIVDSGWACTTQDCLQAVFGESELISGMYLGVSNQGHQPNHRNIKYGLLRDDFRGCRYHNPLESTAGVIRMWDTILREPSGTVLRLHRQNDNKVEPVLGNGMILGDLEYSAADSISRGIHEGTSDRLKEVSLIVKLSEHFTDVDFEVAATMISRNISSRPTANIAKAIIRLGFDEGTAGGSMGSLGGVGGVKNGVAWYPGILARLGFGWMAPLIEAAGFAILKQKTLTGKNTLFGKR